MRRFLILLIGLAGISVLSCDRSFPTTTITAQEFQFLPGRVELPAEEGVQLVIKNQGREPHIFQSRVLSFEGVRLEPEPSWEGWGNGEGIPILPGDQIDIFLVLPEGLYPFRCRIKGHRGMEGTLVVQK